MTNQIFLVGRLIEDPKLNKYGESEKERAVVTLAVPRAYKNAEGEYETDFIDVTLCNGVASNTVEYCRKGDLVGIRGRIETRNIEKDNGEKQKITEIIADRISFLSASNYTNNENE